MRLVWLVLVAPPLAGCGPDPVRMSGQVRSGIDEASGPFADAALGLLDEGGGRMAQARTDASGRFDVEVPAGVVLHLVIDGEGHVPASFTGESGLTPKYAVEDGALHGVTAEEWASWTERFAGCPGVGGPGGAVIAEPRVEELVDDQGEHPGVSVAVAEIWDGRAGEVLATACYLDGEGLAWDPDATATGTAGVFAIFGVPEGVWVLSVGLEVFPGSFTWEDAVVYVPEGGVAPRFPAWVHFPVR